MGNINLDGFVNEKGFIGNADHKAYGRVRFCPPRVDETAR
jgi:hypothetical protein